MEPRPSDRRSLGSEVSRLQTPDRQRFGDDKVRNARASLVLILCLSVPVPGFLRWTNPGDITPLR